jgi:sugar lactone lactonase YvrE
MVTMPKILKVEPAYAIPGAEIEISCEGFQPRVKTDDGCYLDDVACRVTASSSRRAIVRLPEEAAGGASYLKLISGGKSSAAFEIEIGRKRADEMHIVANPAVDPDDDTIILTRSGGRGQRLSETLFRLESDGFVDAFPDAIVNPTGVAFDQNGKLFVTNRAEGEVYEVSRTGSYSVYATGLGIATGIAFDRGNRMYVGDRGGTIHRVTDLGESEVFTVLEPSVAAYHMAFGPDDRLYVTAPGLASSDSVHVIDGDGFDEKFFRGLGRPQGLAFDTKGNLYVAACYRGRHGVVKISGDGISAEHFVAGNGVVGLCFTRAGEMLVATNSSVYSIECGVKGTLLDA